MTYTACRNCGERFFAGANPPEHGRCGVCEPRDRGIDWTAVPNMRRVDGEWTLQAFQDAAAGEEL